MVVVPKKNGALHICLDPKDLNKAIQHEHYPLPTIEDITTRLHGAKLFTMLDVRGCGMWCWMKHLHFSQPSTHPLADIIGNVCHLEFAQHLKCFSAVCMS